MEALGAIPKLDTDTVQRVLGFVFNGLNPAMSGNQDHKVSFEQKIVYGFTLFHSLVLLVTDDPIGISIHNLEVAVVGIIIHA